jgi:DNA modification methylase
MGSGSVGVACKTLNRKFIGIEKDEKYFEIAKKRIENIVKNYISKY